MKSLVSAISLAAVSSIALFSHPVLAVDIERSCNAYYRFHLGGVDNETGNHVFAIAEVIGSQSQFTARRGCGQTVPNRCRRRASEAAMQCMQAHAKNLAQAPAECRSNGVQNYPVDNLEQFAKTQVCAYLKNSGKVTFNSLPPGYSVTVGIKGKVWGDEGCGGGDRRDTEVDLVKNLKIKCD